MGYSTRVYVMMGIVLPKEMGPEMTFIPDEEVEYRGTDWTRTQALWKLANKHGVMIVPMDVDYSHYTVGVELAISSNTRWDPLEIEGSWSMRRLEDHRQQMILFLKEAFDLYPHDVWRADPTLQVFTQVS